MKKKLLKIVSRLLMIASIPFLFAYIAVSVFIIWLPYWLITGEDFMFRYSNVLPDKIYYLIDSIGNER